MDFIEIKYKQKTYNVHLCKVLQHSRVFERQYSNPHLSKEKEIIFNDDFSGETVEILVDYLKTGILPMKLSEQVASELLLCADYLRIDNILKCLDWEGRKAKIFFLEDYGLTDKEGENIFMDRTNILNLPHFKFYAEKFGIETKEGDVICETRKFMLSISCVNYQDKLIANEEYYLAVEFNHLIGREYPFNYWLTEENPESIVTFNIKPFYHEMRKNLKQLGEDVFRTTFQIFHRVFKLYFLPLLDPFITNVEISENFGNMKIHIGNIEMEEDKERKKHIALIQEDDYKPGVDLFCFGYKIYN